MRLKLPVALVVVFGYLTVMLACNTAPPTTGLTQESNTKANSNTQANSNSATNSNTTTASGNSNTTAAVPDDGAPPHAVDTSGKVIPNESATQPDKPIILAKDSENSKPNSGELKPEAAFDHVKHSTLPSYGVDGKTIITCVECHHTDQPSAPKGQEYLAKFERKEVLTTKQLETSKEVVKSCRACHFQASFEDAESPKSVTYPKEMNKPPSGKLTNEVAYHLNCNTCHDAAKKRDPKVKAPQACADCHTSK